MAAFERAELPLAQWHHGAHLAVAAWYLLHQSPEAATDRMRAGIQRYNGIRGTTGDPDGGYHETITLVWLRLIRDRLARTDPGRPVASRIAEVVGALDDQRLPFTYYSRARLMSPEARAGWVEPDLRRLPDGTA